MFLKNHMGNLFLYLLRRNSQCDCPKVHLLIWLDARQHKEDTWTVEMKRIISPVILNLFQIFLISHPALSILRRGGDRVWIWRPSRTPERPAHTIKMSRKTPFPKLFPYLTSSWLYFFPENVIPMPRSRSLNQSQKRKRRRNRDIN